MWRPTRPDAHGEVSIKHNEHVERVEAAIARGRRFEELLAHDLREQQRRERAAW